MLTGNPYDRLVAARLLDFFDSAVPWHRALWTVGTALSLREVCEAADAIAKGVLSPPQAPSCGSPCSARPSRTPAALRLPAGNQRLFSVRPD